MQFCLPISLVVGLLTQAEGLGYIGVLGNPCWLFLIFRSSTADLPNVTVRVCLGKTHHAGAESLPAFREGM